MKPVATGIIFHGSDNYEPMDDTKSHRAAITYMVERNDPRALYAYLKSPWIATTDRIRDGSPISISIVHAYLIKLQFEHNVHSMLLHAVHVMLFLMLQGTTGSVTHDTQKTA